MRIIISDAIGSPAYSWPRTLVSYDIDFSQVKIKPGNLRLREKRSGQAVPVQILNSDTDSDGVLKRAQIAFFSDLKPNAAHEFELFRATDDDKAKKCESRIIATAHDSVLEITTGSMSVRIPQKRAFADGDFVPAPIMALKHSSGWIGNNSIKADGQKAVRLDVEPVSTGDLTHIYKLTYYFDKGAAYIVTLKITDGYDFIEYDEEMRGFEETDNARVEMDWTGFAPTHRHAAMSLPEAPGVFGIRPERWLRIDEQLFTTDVEEDPKWIQPNLEEDVTREMAFRLSAYSGNGIREAVPAVSFWDERAGGEELGLFVLDTMLWQDNQYMLWQPSTNLQVRFRFENNTLRWSWPLSTGHRNTGIALGNAKTNQQKADAVLGLYASVSPKGDGVFRGGGSALAIENDGRFPFRYVQSQRAWHGALNLDRVKNWVLTYPRGGSKPADVENARGHTSATPEELESLVKSSVLMTYGAGLNPITMNIRHRAVRMIADYYRLAGQSLSPDKKQQIDALLLLSAYINAGEELSPSRICLAGTPNMAADTFIVPPIVAALFPDHPMGAVWRDQFETIIKLMNCYYTRPAVPAWNALEGRWVESMGTYNWGYLLPILAAQRHIYKTDGSNRLANEWMAWRGRWMVDQLSAPIYNPDPYWRQATNPKPPPMLSRSWKPGDQLDSTLGFERQYPAHGAHGSGSGIVPPRQLVELASYLTRYDPLTAEHLFWVDAQVRSKDTGEWNGQRSIEHLPPNNGTKPVLRSVKYTGHGLILRAGVDTPDEVSIHLDQVDAGANYRWGNNGEGANGTIYYFAQGKLWSGHERENTGDHFSEESISATNYGFMKGGKYRSIGANTLTRPLYDLGVAQFGELVSRKGAASYSWPQYESRSVMLVGTDYIVIYDSSPTEAAGRFSWFTVKDQPFPKLMFLEPQNTRPDHWTEVQTNISKGILRDTRGSSLVVVTHRGDEVEMDGMSTREVSAVKSLSLKQYAWKNKADVVPGVYSIKTPGGLDRVFRWKMPIVYNRNKEVFEGMAGVIRNCKDGATKLALFKGSVIGAKGVRLSIPNNTEAGMSASFKNNTEISGVISASVATPLSVSFEDASKVSSAKWYVDGGEVAFVREKNTLTATISAGRHRWEITDKLPTPSTPEIERTENRSGGASVLFKTVSGADVYKAQISNDDGASWKDAGSAKASPLTISGLKNGGKIHIRMFAVNRDRKSEASAQYPIYINDTPPPPPDGVSMTLSKGSARIEWGEVLGVEKYNLYRRKPGSDWELVYTGLERHYVDSTVSKTREPDALPCDGSTIFARDSVSLTEYAVSCANGNGEGVKSAPVDTNPSNWKNWWPADQPRVFKRHTAYWLPPYVSPDRVPPLRYRK